MGWTLLQTKEDVDWCKEVHLRNLPDALKAEIHSILLDGNEDSPDKITCYASDNPREGDKPVFVIHPID